MPLNLHIREETPVDLDLIRDVTVSAFSGSEYGHQGEAQLVDLLRAVSDRFLSLVACVEGEVVGHVMFTPVIVKTHVADFAGMGLAPLSVHPFHQRQGIGSALVKHGLDKLCKDGCPFVVVLGHPDYYNRFGFRSASQNQVVHGFSGLPQDPFLIRINEECLVAKLIGGKAYYHPAFGDQHAEH